MIKTIITRKCIKCDTEFSYRNTKKNSNRGFCSSLCARKNNGENNKNRRHSEEARKKISESISGINNPFYGKKHTGSALVIMSEKRKRSTQSRLKYTNADDIQRSVMNGLLISDGSISKNPGGYSARLTLGFQYKETLDRISHDLSSVRFGKIIETKRTRLINECTSYHCKSLSYADFTETYHRWYINGIKHIDKSISIDPTFLYWWYICDGYITKYGACLCTESFNDKDLEWIAKKLSEISIESKITKRKRILISRKSTLSLFNMIRDNNITIQKEYLYKFQIKWKIEEEH
jgi:hypothetical protein